MEETVDQAVVLLPPRAELLFQILVRSLCGKKYCWPGQKKLAAELGISGRQVIRLIALLETSGKIEIERTNRTNTYWIPPRQVTPMSPICHLNVTSGCDTDVTCLSHPDVTRMSPLHEVEKEKQQQAKESAAAVASPLEREDPIPALIELGMPSEVKPIAEADISLADAVLSHCFWRFSTGKPPKSKTGYLVGCLTHPTKFSFSRNAAGEWAPPPGESRPRPEDLECKQAAANAAYARWKGLSEADREKVFQRAVKAFTFYEYLGRESASVIAGCVKMMRQMEDEGKL
jgi:hypothetical protein